MMLLLDLIEKFPIDLLVANIFTCLELEDLVRLERASSNDQQSKLIIRNILPHCSPVDIGCNDTNDKVIDWLGQTRCPILSINIHLPGENPILDRNFLVRNYHLNFTNLIDIADYYIIQKKVLHNKITKLSIKYVHNIQTLQHLSECLPNVTILSIDRFNYIDWITTRILKNWNLFELSIHGITTERISGISSHLYNLTCLQVLGGDIDDTTVIAILQACPKLTTLHLCNGSYTYNSLLSISNSNISLEKLYIPKIPIIPTANIAKGCSRALSCIQDIGSTGCAIKEHVKYCIPYLTGLISVKFSPLIDPDIVPLLAQYCHNIQCIIIHSNKIPIDNLLPLFINNTNLKELHVYCCIGLTDSLLIELAQSCPYLHTLDISLENVISNTGMLALSEHCHQLIALNISSSSNVTETAVIQLLQQCRQLKCLHVSKLSLSAEAAVEVKKTRNISINLL